MKRATLFFVFVLIFFYVSCVMIPPQNPGPPPPPGPPGEIMTSIGNVFEYYAWASTELLANQLPAGKSLGPGRDTKDFDRHIKYADKSPEKIRKELIEKFRIMIAVMETEGPIKFAEWYAFCCVGFASLGVDFGSAEANSSDFNVHEKWALGPVGKPDPAALERELIFRVDNVFVHYGF